LSVAELSTPADVVTSAAFERTPPHDITAEQCVLGGMMLSADAIADVVEVINSRDFYRPAHEIAFDTILGLYGRGEPVDAVTVAAQLTKSGQLSRIGGAPYLHTLISSVPTAANAGYYAKIVRERAILRRLVEAGTKITQMGYAADGDADEIVDSAQAEIYGVTESRTSEDYLPLSAIMPAALDEMEAIASHTTAMVGVPAGFADLDALITGFHPAQLIVVAARPGLGKSTLSLDFSRSCSIKHGMTSVIFSLEMARNEITMRLLSAEARVPLQHMRTGTMTDDEWNRLARRMGEVSSAPLFIDDSPHVSMTQIRAKCRRLKQRHDLRLVIVDYLQLMQTGRRVESRQLEVSELSRSLKLLAKELDVPVIAVSQLNRGPEQRQDHRPQLSDLRESGCLTGDTTLLRADNGVPITFAELLEHGHDGVLVWSLDETRRLVPAPIANVFPSGVKDVYRLRLASGREVKATGNHQFLTFRKWAALETLGVGDRIAIPRRIPEPINPGLGWSEHRLGTLADIDAQSVNSNVDCLDDVFWDRIVAIEPLGSQPVYDATVKGTHNFLADGIVAHNSIEQDSDMVILLHRVDAYDKDSARAGEADLIVAKHRNGPTATITVAFQGHYSRFVDMAQH